MTVQWTALAALSALAAHAAFSQISAAAAACSAPAYRQFDFWIGDWDVFDAGDPTAIVAHARVERILDGCVLLEDYQGTDGAKGRSFSMYDASTKVWRQNWVTNRGRWLQLAGGLQGGEMALSGVDRSAGGRARRIRGVWKLDRGGIRETAVTSTDGGRTWKPWFDLCFRPHQP
ncbi:MAG TPA: hypothetical protein VMQ86_22770 [Bryobacteraceae bacterium]|jgi:hypothetical protein|nr:hypothetical protein [Bryobacteraceae bacterium]